MLQLLGIGLSRTGTKSLTHALRILGYNSIHWRPERLENIVNGHCQNPDFRRYDDVDAVTDIPAAYFWRELWNAYPDLKFILTWRDPDDWYHSVENHYKRIAQPDRRLQTLVYGSPEPTAWLYKKHFCDHASAAIALIPPDRLLTMNILAGDGWDKLCEFLSTATPDTPFPHEADTTSNFQH